MVFPPRGSRNTFPRSFQSGASVPASRQSTPSFPAERDLLGVFNLMQESQFDVLEWYPHFQSCVRYFLDHAQYDGPVQAMAAFMNIQLPFQKPNDSFSSSRQAGSPSTVPPSTSSSSTGQLPILSHPPASISVTPFIRRLIATGFDFPGVLHGFFGDDWEAGIGRLHEIERRNYLFAAKASNWLDVKAQYDMPDGQSIPFLRPLQNVTEEEIVNAESTWSQWLAMQDWMIGPRNFDDTLAPVMKTEDS
ncbi:hypothetical protein F5Y16DRAFT_219018 [Xylariaceae sp. FL0255]|nr:hypothetical protein F5Y16DRAFT_219018 [Xylariaceae sp. FL0255]